MDLLTALTRASAFAVKEGPRSHVRVFPPIYDDRALVVWEGAVPQPHYAARVFASDGVVQVTAQLDTGVDVPAVAPHAAALKKVLAVAKADAFGLHRLSPTTCGVVTGAGTTMLVMGMDPDEYPAHIPAAPALSLVAAEDVERLSSVVHAAVKDDPDRSALECLHVTPTWVEATDQIRVARAAVSGIVSEPVLVPARLFRKIPSGEVRCGLDAGTFFLQVGDELRWAKVRPASSYIDLSYVFRIPYPAQCILPIDETLVGVKAAAAASDCDTVELAFGSGRISIHGRSSTGHVVSVADFVAFGSDRPSRVALRGKVLLEGLKARTGPEPVCVSYDVATTPLALRQGPVVELIWPLSE